MERFATQLDEEAIENEQQEAQDYDEEYEEEEEEVKYI